MSGTPDWKPGLRARPSSLAGSLALVPVAPVTLRASPSSIDLSGRHEHAPLTSQMGDNQSKHVPKRAICDAADEDKPCNRRVRIRGPIFGGDATARSSSNQRPDDQVNNRAMVPPMVPVEPHPRPHTGNTVDQGWKTGACFRHIMRPGLAHRVYDGPPDGTARVRLGPEEVMVDFARPYKIYALFINDVYLAVQIKIPEQLNMSGFSNRSRMVWSNMRRGDDWWARLIDPDLSRDLQRTLGREDDTEKQHYSDRGCLAIRRLPLNPRAADAD